ncbi:uncharacterized protein LOC143850390 [Tasmannia lanceolata]|uniref:uncharacterized protein LOC143850390 n=1 Tax=Tasmannia lanceolata TaxID=3420 RepID=UPI004063D618
MNRVFTISQQDADASDTVIEGQLFINKMTAFILFDSGSSLTFISPAFVKELDLKPSSLQKPLKVMTPVGQVAITSEVILGMDWLASYHASVDCFHKTVSFKIPGEKEFIFEGVKRPKEIKLIATLEAQKLIKQGCECYLAHVEVEKDVGCKLSAADIPVVREFLDVFPEDLMELPPHRDIDFTIDLEPGLALSLKHHT